MWIKEMLDLEKDMRFLLMNESNVISRKEETI